MWSTYCYMYYYYFSGTMQEVLISIAIFLTTSNKTTKGLNPKQKQSKSGFPKYSLFCQETFMVVLSSHLILLITLRTPSSARSYPPLGKQNTYVFKKYILAVLLISRKNIDFLSNKKVLTS